MFLQNNLCLRGNIILKQAKHCQELLTETFSRIFRFVTHRESSDVSNPWPGYRFTGSLEPCYPLSDKRHVPPSISRPDYAEHHLGCSLAELAVSRNDPIRILTNNEINDMKVVCKLTRECLDMAIKVISPGVKTDFIDEILHKAAIERNCYPSPLNYYNFPKSCCTSVNEVICHGIPDSRRLLDGDIVNVDVSCFYNGFHGDVSETVFVGDVDEESRSLVKTAYECLMCAISEVKPGLHYRDLGTFIENKAAANGYSVNKSYCGHGINQLFHTNPSVPHFAGNRANGVMEPGHVFTIEPMINEGIDSDGVWPDGWTVVTRDGKRSAQFEHTVLVTETGVDVLTRRNGSGQPHFMD